MKVTMEKLGITASYSRPRVSNDNPFSEALIPDLQISPGLADQGSLCNESRCASLGKILRQLVVPIRDPQRASCWPGQRDTRKPRHSLCNCTGAKTGTVVRQNPKLATGWTSLAQPRKRKQRL